MENLLCEFLEWVICYFNDIALFSDSWEEHIDLINKVCTIIKKAGFKVSPNKCDWAKQEEEILGYLITLNGLKLLWSKINAILAMKKPENLKQLQSFLGLVTFYYDMWPQWSHVLTSLPTYFLQQNTSGQIEQDVTFLCMKSLVSQDTLLVFPDPNKPFLIETDASDYQLGAVIKQHNSNETCPSLSTDKS